MADQHENESLFTNNPLFTHSTSYPHPLQRLQKRFHNLSNVMHSMHMPMYKSIMCNKCAAYFGLG